MDLPPIGVVVNALCRCSINWPDVLGKPKVTEYTYQLKRIKSKSNSKGWQWSGATFDSYFAHEVISWEFINNQ